MNFLDSIIKGYTDRVLGPDTSQAGAQTASAYENIMNELNKGTQPPGDGVGPTPTPMDPLDRWRAEIDMMMSSGNPALQEQAMGMMQKFHETATEKPSGDTTPAAIKEYQYAVNQGYKGSFQDWKKENKAGTIINMGGEDRVTVNEAEKLVYPDGTQVQPGTTWQKANDGGAILKQSKDQTTTGTGVDVMTDSFNLLRDNIDASSDPIEGFGTVLRTQPNIFGQAINVGMTQAGIPMSEAATKFNTANRTISGQITKLMNGASATEGERDYWASLQPLFTDDERSRKIKFNEMVKFGKSMAKRARDAGVKDIPDFEGIQLFEISDDNLPSLPPGFYWDN